MIASLLRLFALRPFLTMAIMGVPVLILVAIGMLTVVIFKVLLFVVPIVFVVWLLRRMMRSSSETQTTS
jgi:type IV secretory pathway VirB3-like protein